MYDPWYVFSPVARCASSCPTYAHAKITPISFIPHASLNTVPAYTIPHHNAVVHALSAIDASVHAINAPAYAQNAPRVQTAPSRPSIAPTTHAIATGVVIKCKKTLNELLWYARNSIAVSENRFIAVVGYFFINADLI